MKRIVILTLVLGLALVFLAACGGDSDDEDEDDDEEELGTATAETTLCPVSSGSAIPFEDALVFIEFNSTDEDLGFHATFDAEGWKEAVICGPDGSKLFEVKARGSTEKHGLSELFFEGAEPSLDEQPLDEFLARFPEGEYTIVGEDNRGRHAEEHGDIYARHPGWPCHDFACRGRGGGPGRGHHRLGACDQSIRH